MSSKPRRCTKTGSWPTAGAALWALRKMPSHHRGIRIYPCGKHSTETWHITSKEKIRRRKR